MPTFGAMAKGKAASNGTGADAELSILSTEAAEDDESVGPLLRLYVGGKLPQEAHDVVAAAAHKLLLGLKKAYAHPFFQAQIARFYEEADENQDRYLPRLGPAAADAQRPVFERFGLPGNQSGVMIMKVAVKKLAQDRPELKEIAGDLREQLLLPREEPENFDLKAIVGTPVSGDLKSSAGSKERTAGVEDLPDAKKASKPFAPPSRSPKERPEKRKVAVKSASQQFQVFSLESNEAPVRREDLGHDVRVHIYVEGDGKTAPKEYVEAHLTGRLPGGMVFESTRGKGAKPMNMKLGKHEILPGMELGLRALTLGARAVIYIPAQLGYGSHGVPMLIPPNTDLTFEVELLEVDGVKAEEQERQVPPMPAHPPPRSEFNIPWWVARVERPAPNEYYLSFCRHMARGSPGELPRSRAIPKIDFKDVDDWNLDTDGAAVVRGMQSDWLAAKQWDVEWLRQELGSETSLVKWLGPLFRKEEVLSDIPVYEALVAEYIDYIQALEAFDPLCLEENAPHCPRLYLNGWPIFLQMPHLRKSEREIGFLCANERWTHAGFADDFTIISQSASELQVKLPAFVDDVSHDLLEEMEHTKNTLLTMFLGKNARESTEVLEKRIDDKNWELTKLFISPKGSITRLHYDNGGSHAWLSQVRGRKLFVCYPPEEGKYLHPFEGDEGQLSGSWIDPFAEDVLEKWPDYENATPLVAIVEEGETIFAPQGWWHYAVALDTSITIMRNFHTTANSHEFYVRHDPPLQEATRSVLKGSKMMVGKTAKELEEFTLKLLSDMRAALKVKLKKSSD